MKKTITLFTFCLLASVVVKAQVSVFQSGVSRYWLTFMMQNNRPSGDLLYSKDLAQPNTTINSFNATIGRYNMATATETMTMTLRGIEGMVYNWGSNFFFNIGFLLG
ncbi:MAG: hypothetical protein EOO93_03045 [Pedobacter sp.]|nr:MAG: hypothetical protein EOO93_03045 [Pedobacter sp.]